MNFPELEEKILKNWKQIDAFKKSVEKRAKDPAFVFYEGPPTANGMPGFHHVEARSYKDIICRYKTMRGFRVERPAGWDTHGLPVEIQVEKELGLKNKKDIEEYGIAEFNAKCRESVWRYQKEWEELTERMGFWVDMENPYVTLDPLYMESLWWIIKQAWDKKLLYEGHRVTPYCTRCGTGLSSHEVAQGYQDVKDNSVYVKFKIKGEKNKYLLAWTTTPWTLPGNVALAVGKDITYVTAKQGDEEYVLAKDLLEDVFEGNEYEVEEEYKGKDLVGMEYEPLFDIKELQSETSHKVYAADFVTTEDGTGIVHTAVMYGEDDYNLGKEIGLPTVHTVNESGEFNELVKGFAGKPVKDEQTDIDIIIYLKENNLLLRKQKYEHSYPHCWRCGTPLLYYAMSSWFMGMESLQKDLISANEKVNWVPEHIKEGRFGEWLRNVKDWAFSRSRYWGTPLPVWRCEECYHTEVLGSREEIAKSTKGKNAYWLMRHGHSEGNENQILVSDPSTKHPMDKLTEKGKKQAKETAEQIKKEGGVDIIVTSPLGRTIETAEIVGEALGVKVIKEDLLKEIDLGIYEGKTEKEYGDYFQGAKDYDFTKGVPEGENLVQTRKRMLEVVNNLEEKYKDKKILIISHGHPLWVLETALRGLTIDEAVKWKRSGEYPLNAQLRKVEYAKFPYNDLGDLDLHRPFVDEITFPCPTCKDTGTMRRVQDLVDVWFDSGSMPFAQQHYPFENKETIDKNKAYPADYIAEAMDQTRGWFYTLLAVSAILGRAPSYKNVITLGIVLDEDGQKMSKSKGNIVDPKELASKYGMDSVRWYFFTVNQPGDPKLFSERDVRDRWQRFISTFINSYTFFETYAHDATPPKTFSISSSTNILDKWIFIRLREVSAMVTEYLNAYNVLDAARTLEDFIVEDISNWYIRRSRERLQRPSSKKENEEAVKTLGFVLNEVSKITAPFVPFVSEYVWQGLNKTKKQSVHWEDYPDFGKKELTSKEKDILETMSDVRSWAQSGLRLRSDHGIKVRQPLEALAVPRALDKEYAEVLKEEINVKEIAPIDSAQVNEKDWVAIEDSNGKIALKTALSPELEMEGKVREMVRHIQSMRKSLGLHPKDEIDVVYSMPESLHGSLSRFEEKIASDTNTLEISEKAIEDSAHYDAKDDFDWDAKHSVQVAINKRK